VSGQPNPVSAAGGTRVRPCDSFWIITSVTCGLIPHAALTTASIVANDPRPAGTGLHQDTATPGQM
jgi:hypothetical protein